MAGATTNININNSSSSGNNVDNILHATNSIMHAVGNVDANGNLLHHPNTVVVGAGGGVGLGLANANAHSLYAHHNSPVMMTLNPNFTGVNRSSVPFTYLSSATQPGMMAAPGNAIHPVALPII